METQYTSTFSRTYLFRQRLVSISDEEVQPTNSRMAAAPGDFQTMPSSAWQQVHVSFVAPGDRDGVFRVCHNSSGRHMQEHDFFKFFESSRSVFAFKAQVANYSSTTARFRAFLDATDLP